MKLKTIIVVAVLVAAVVAGCFFEVYSFTDYSCLECRATLAKRRVFGIPFQWVSHNSYSNEVLAHEPLHHHHWRWCGWEHSYSFLAITYSCGRQHPIWRLPISVQARYSKLVPAAKLQKALQTIDSGDREAAMAAVIGISEQVLEDADGKPKKD